MRATDYWYEPAFKAFYLPVCDSLKVAKKTRHTQYGLFTELNSFYGSLKTNRAFLNGSLMYICNNGPIQVKPRVGVYKENDCIALPFNLLVKL